MRAVSLDDDSIPATSSGQLAGVVLATAVDGELPVGVRYAAPADHRIGISDGGAAIAQQLVEPVTALLLYIGELKRIASGPDAPADLPMRIIDSALRETERVCALIVHMRAAFGASDATIASDQSVLQDPPAPVDDGSATARLRSLTTRESEVLDLIVAGFSNKQGASSMSISPRTFESHRAQIMRKLGARNAAQLLRTVLIDAK